MKRKQPWPATYATSEVERFRARGITGPADECWLWPGAKSRNGYGLIYRQGSDGSRVHVHRVAWEAAHGEPPPPDLVIRHACDTRLCVNPAHLAVGTQRENVQDIIDRSRRSKTVPAEVVEAVRARYTAGERQADLAREYGLDRGYVCRLVNGKRR